MPIYVGNKKIATVFKGKTKLDKIRKGNLRKWIGQIITPDPSISVLSDTTSSITIRLTNNHDKQVTVYYEHNDNTPDAYSVVIAANSTADRTISSLSANTTYTIYAYALENGQLPSSVVSVNETTDKNTTANPSIVNVTPSQNSVTFGLKNNDGSTATIYYEVNDSTPDITVSVGAGQTVTRTISGLNASTGYTLYARARASNENMSSTVNTGFTTLADIFDIQTGFTRYNTGTDGLRVWTPTVFEVDTDSYHRRSEIYKDLGTTSGKIKFRYRYNTGNSGGYTTSNNHRIFGMRESSISRGRYYNEDGFTGWDVRLRGTGNPLTVSLMEYGNRTHNNDSNYVVKDYNPGRNVDFIVELWWQSNGVHMWLDGVYSGQQFPANSNLTFASKGYAMYNGLLWMDILPWNRTSIPSSFPGNASPYDAYSYGNENTSVTGGWIETRKYNSFGTDRFIKASSYIEYGDAGSGYEASGTRTANAVDLTGYTSIEFEYDNIALYGTSSYNSNFSFNISTSASSTVQNTSFTRGVGLSGTSAFGTGTLSLDVSDLSGFYYIWGNTGSGSFSNHESIVRLKRVSLS